MTCQLQVRENPMNTRSIRYLVYLHFTCCCAFFGLLLLTTRFILTTRLIQHRYIGHCIKGSFCFSLDEMNQGDNSKLQLWVEGPPEDPDTPTITVTDIDHSDPDSAERRKNEFGEGQLGPLVHFRRWGKSANDLFERRGIIYAELIMSGKGLPTSCKGPKKNEPNFFCIDAKFTLQEHVEYCSNDPRKVLSWRIEFHRRT